MKEALVIIDVQNDYFSGGRCELYHPNEALEVTKQLLDSFRKRKLPVIFIQHIMLDKGFFFEEGTKGVEIHSEIKPLSTETVIVKHAPSSFYQTSFEECLKDNQVTDLVVCGMMTHMCVDTTVRVASDYGYHTTLIQDACTTKDMVWDGKTYSAEVVHNIFVGALSGGFADVKTGKEYLNNH